MKITRENYESFFIDLIDGTLTNNKVDELLDFMRENPDLAEELKGLETVKLEYNEHLKYSSKSLLKTDWDQADVFEETCIRSIENELSKLEESNFQQYLLKNKNAANEYRLFNATKSEPDTLIRFGKKDALKRKQTILPYWFACAAAILIGFLLWFNFNKTETQNKVLPIVQLSETVNVELKMQYYKPTLAKFNEEKPKSTPLVIELIPENIPQKTENLALLSSKQVMVAACKTKASDKINLIPVEHPNQKTYPNLREYLALEINKIDPEKGLKNLSQSALNKLVDVSNDKINYDVSNDGKVTRIEFNSRILAFSFPINSK